MISKAIQDSYWVLPGQFMAGEYPCSLDATEARQKMRWLLASGIDFFIDLTQAGESGLIAYTPYLFDEAASMEVEVMHKRMSIPDMDIPSQEEMKNILDELDSALAKGHRVYLHCYGGIGRTGTVVGCYLVRKGMDGVDAIRHIANLRQGTPDGWRDSPETPAQKRFILDWCEHDPLQGD